VAHDRARVTAPEPPETLHHRDRAAFVALVPGALSLTSVADAAEGHTGITGIAVAGSAVLSLALGTMVGWSIVQAVQGAARRGTVTDRQLAVSR